MTSTGYFNVAGVLVADGRGTITSGVEDINQGTLGLLQNVAFSGSYSVQADGRGTATISSSSGTFTFRFVLVSDSDAYIIEFDNLAGMNGRLEKQDTTAFSNSTLNASYVFGYGGARADGFSQETVGTFVLDGAGTVSAGSLDINDAGTTSSNRKLQRVFGRTRSTDNQRGPVGFLSLQPLCSGSQQDTHARN